MKMRSAVIIVASLLLSACASGTKFSEMAASMPAATA
jgi:outer membrane murein-binding lipoprotein Lpp